VVEDDDYQLRWPRHLLRTELEAITAISSSDSRRRDRFTVVLADAFTTPLLSEEFAALPQGSPTSAPWDDPWTQSPQPAAPQPAAASPDAFINNLLARLDTIRYEGAHAPYYSQRRAGAESRQLNLHGVATGVRALLMTLAARGYFEHAFGKDCPDDPADHTPSEVIELRVGRPLTWTISPDELVVEPANLYDLIEVLHDLAAFPRARRYHGWDNCGWHHSEFAAGTGRAVYRWSVNRILERSDLGLRLAEEGEDRGRLVATTDPDRELLAQQMATRDDPATGDRVRHAMSLFRARTATEHDKRSACIALAGVLEERRGQLRVELLRKDEGALFHIANSFAVRHQGAQQQGDYDPLFLDWVYWLYLATIELTDRLAARQHAQ